MLHYWATAAVWFKQSFSHYLWLKYDSCLLLVRVYALDSLNWFADRRHITYIISVEIQSTYKEPAYNAPPVIAYWLLFQEYKPTNWYVNNDNFHPAKLHVLHFQFIFIISILVLVLVAAAVIVFLFREKVPTYELSIFVFYVKFTFMTIYEKDVPC